MTLCDTRSHTGTKEKREESCIPIPSHPIPSGSSPPGIPKLPGSDRVTSSLTLWGGFWHGTEEGWRLLAPLTYLHQQRF